MNLQEYQEEAKKTAIYPDKFSILYPALGLAGEVGEFCNKLKKVLRDFEGNFDTSGFMDSSIDELGDIFWYLAQLCSDMGISLDDVAAQNLRKLASRQIRGTLHGSGDER